MAGKLPQVHQQVQYGLEAGMQKAKLKSSKRTPDCLEWRKRAETLQEAKGSQARADWRAVYSVTLMTLVGPQVSV